MLGQLIKSVRYQRWIDTLVTAGVDAAAIDSVAIDCQSFDRILVAMDIGATATNAGTVKFYLTECDTAAGVFKALAGATIGTHTHGNSGEAKKTYIIDAKLSKRFVKIVYQREVQNSTIDSGFYMLYNGKRVPETPGAALKELVVT